ncbi:PASTA domain-containing protein [Micromonospora nigra]|uniref:PASTA domain-containing protein n=1 Tax=Micromonospora nigra TaxID=145857 RepID=A0A1C6SGW1_9ACTN|nr:PASTA domain-containing protein [Micromonospora nigra]SCL28578.1 PASTA domain-containing protein [Micromonospora nigra]
MTDATSDEIRPAALTPPSSCAIGWQPSALAPVFWGWHEYGPADSAPTRVRVFHPSIDTSPNTAQLLSGCGRYPLIVFAHGYCAQDTNHYQRWFRTPAALARCGYIVAVPELPDIHVHPARSPGTQQVLADTVTWMRQGWPGKAVLLPAAKTGLAGHSYGALHAGILATRIQVAAVASLSGVWNDWQPGYGTKPIHQGTVPRLLTWGVDDFGATLDAPSWNAIAKPKHRAVYGNADHYDYFPYNQNVPCRTSSGPCPHVGIATDDLLMMFFANYLPPELWPDLPGRIPDNLVPPPLNLPPEKAFYAGNHLNGLSIFNGNSSCSVSLSVELPLDKTVPNVRESLRPQADQAVRAAGLVPVFTGSTSPGAWVASQSPAGGTKVVANSTVTMTMQSGPLP